MAANEPNIKKWFKEYAEVLEKLHIESPEYIWSGDETCTRVMFTTLPFLTK